MNLDNKTILLSRGYQKYSETIFEPMYPSVSTYPTQIEDPDIPPTNDFPLPFELGNVETSWLKFISVANFIKTKDIYALKQFLAASECLELLSPDKLRMGSAPNAENIGLGGGTLASFIHSMGNEQKRQINKIVSNFVGFKTQIKTKVIDGKIELFASEQFKNASPKINADHISDGLLRIIAFAAISIQTKNEENIKASPFYSETLHRELVTGMILLDEIEDGINPYLAEKTTELLKSVVKQSNRQIIITTHSPILVNRIEPDDIIFLWKSDDGTVHCKHMFSTDEMRDTLEFLNPGEAWLNYDKDEILNKMNQSMGTKDK
jgi:predicted ATPase